MPWTRKLSAPIVLKDGRLITTLGQGRALMLNLPVRNQVRPYWQYTAELLLIASKNEGALEQAHAQLSRALMIDRPDRPNAHAGLRAVRAQGQYSVARLQAKHRDARLTDLRTFLTALTPDCPKRAKRSIHAQCAAKYDPPPETRRERPTW